MTTPIVQISGPPVNGVAQASTIVEDITSATGNLYINLTPGTTNRWAAFQLNPI